MGNKNLARMYSAYDGKLSLYYRKTYLDGDQAERLATLESFYIFRENYVPEVDRAYINNTWYDDDERTTILMILVCSGDLEFVKFLVDEGADVNSIAKFGETSLYLAASCGWQDIYDYLLPLTRENLVVHASKRLKRGLKYRKKRKRYLPDMLDSAYQSKNITQLREAILLGAEVDYPNLNSKILARQAYLRCDTEAVQMLLDTGQILVRDQ
ncbi:MAG: ankyrin repeat domain-containing protein [Cyanobacteria bacterium P01_E01_bin.42]